MNSFLKLTKTNLKLFSREPVALFFTIAFPLMLLLLFGAMFGNDPDPRYGNGTFGYIDSYIPALAAIVIGTVALQSIPISTATQREQKILRRFKATPMPSSTYILADVVSNFLVSLVGMVVLIIFAKLIFNLRFGGSILNIALGYIVAAVSFIAIGYVIASVAPTSRIAQAIGSVIYFPMMFLSGAAFPLQMMPDGIQRVANLLPMTHMVKLLQELWFGIGWNQSSLIVLVVMLVVGAVISIFVFRWE